ncbi:hypothetical protein BVY01_01820 [bacterium I07]|nr:hypothetical protein BVY01_01820 [bacterium I07]
MNNIKWCHRLNGFRPVLILMMLLVLMTHEAFTQGHDVALIKTGRVWSVVTATGEDSPGTSAATGWFPADYDVVAYEDGNAGARTLTIYVLDYIDADGDTTEKKSDSPITDDFPNGIIVEPLKSYVRYGYPNNIMKGEAVITDPLGEIDPVKLIGTSDQTITSIFDYSIGIRAERKIFCWSQQYHDDYIVVDITLTNIGNVTHKDVLLAQQWDLPDLAWGNNPNPSGLSDNNYNWWHYYGSAPGDTQRVYYAYHADDPQQVGDTMGRPAFGQMNRLIRPGAGFWGFLHISEKPFNNPADDVDDPDQPITTYVAKGGQVGDYAGADYDAALGMIADQNPDPTATPGTHHEINNDESGSPDFQNFSTYVVYRGGNRPRVAIGPYATWAPGESIRYIYVTGHAGLSLQKVTEIGRQMVEGTLQAPPNLPDPVQGYFPANFVFPDGANEMDLMKDLWLSTIIDSVHEAMYRARWNMEHDWNVPGAPPPPEMEVEGFGGYVEIKWRNTEAEALPNFAGYRIMRKLSNLDTTFYEIIHETPPGEKAAEHVYQDSDLQFGASYYYYVQTGVRVDEDDQDAVPVSRGNRLWSGRAYLPTPNSIEPARAAAEALDDVIIAPNPYNINDPKVIAQGWVDFRGIVFFNLPTYVKIKIYTEDGDLVKTIIHQSEGDAGSLQWNMLTETQQVIASGVYIATFEADDGGVAYRKFVVAR